jgi:hypothetical protein
MDTNPGHGYIEKDDIPPTISSKQDCAVPFIILQAAEILQLGGIMSSVSISREEYDSALKDFDEIPNEIGPKVNRPLLWKLFIDALLASGNDDTPDGVDLYSWPREISQLCGIKRDEFPDADILSLDALRGLKKICQYLSIHFLGDKPGPSHNNSRLALLNDGEVMLVPKNAVTGDIVACLNAGGGSNARVAVRRCVPKDMEQVELDHVADRLDYKRKFQHCSLVGVCDKLDQQDSYQTWDLHPREHITHYPISTARMLKDWRLHDGPDAPDYPKEMPWALIMFMY